MGSFSPTVDQEKAIVAWLQENAMPITAVEAGSDTADLQPLKAILRDVRIVGLGETTHGTCEFFQFKHRLLEFLVTEMGFTAFAIESSFAACQAINDYVLSGQGDRAAALTGQGYVAWDTDEFLAMLDWMRDYNRTVPDARKVKFYGLDLWRNQNGREKVLDDLRAVGSDRLAATESLFEALAREEAKWPIQIDAEILRQLRPQVDDLIASLDANRDGFVSRSSPEAFERALKYVRVMAQWLTANGNVPPPPGFDEYDWRSVGMGENLVELVEQSGAETRFVLWAHNYHVARSNTWVADGPNLGWGVSRKYGSAYFAFAFEFERGTYTTRLVTPDRGFAELKEGRLSAPPEGSLPAYLARVTYPRFILNLRAPVTSPAAEAWLATPLTVHHVGWAYQDESELYPQWRVAEKYDGLIFIRDTHATHPSAGALSTVAAGQPM